MQKNDNYLTGKLLLAMPGIGDPRFHRAVIFICSHDANGAMGLVINQSMPSLSFEDIVGQLKIKSDINIDVPLPQFLIMCGGPVDSSRGFLLHSPDFHHKETMDVDESYAVTGTIEALKDVLRGQGPKNVLFILGYAGWTAGQLDDELQQNAWLVVDPDPSIIFHDVPEEKWQLAIGKLGFDPAMLSSHAGRA